MKKNAFVSRYNIRADTLLDVGYVAVILIPCICYECLSKMDSLWNISKDKYNKYWYEGSNQNCVYCPFLWTYNNTQLIHCIDSRKQNNSTNTDIDVYKKHNSIGNIYLSVGKDISDSNYGEISTVDKNAENGYYLVKWTSYSYTLHSSHKIFRDVIKAISLVSDAVYLNPFANFKKW